jgi:integrase
MEGSLDLHTVERKIRRFLREEILGKDADMRAWVYQREQSWYVGWRDPNGRRCGKSCGRGKLGKCLAAKERNRIHAELVTGIYGSNQNKTWAEFRTDYVEKTVKLKARATQIEIVSTFDTFERIVAPKKMAAITTAVIDKFKAARSGEKSKRTLGETVSPATINKELRHVKAALRKARKWEYLDKEPEFEMLRELLEEPTYIDPEQFVKLYLVCDKARIPLGLAYRASDWWRGLIITAYMTGWRIGQLLALQRDDIDLEAAEAKSRALAGKGKRDKRKPLHPVIVSHLRRMPGFTAEIFPWPHHRRTLDKEFHFLCRTADLPEFGFHDLRRGFATMNAERMTADALQEWMEHKSYLTTKRYVAVARQIRQVIPNLFVPDLIENASANVL